MRVAGVAATMLALVSTEHALALDWDTREAACLALEEDDSGAKSACLVQLVQEEGEASGDIAGEHATQAYAQKMQCDEHIKQCHDLALLVGTLRFQAQEVRTPIDPGVGPQLKMSQASEIAGAIMRECEGHCEYGCSHAVVTEYAARLFDIASERDPEENPDDDALRRLYAWCPDVRDEYSIPCVHAVGHAFATRDSTLEGAVADCQRASPLGNRDVNFVRTCLKGVFLEHTKQKIRAAGGPGSVPGDALREICVQTEDAWYNDLCWIEVGTGISHSLNIDVDAGVALCEMMGQDVPSGVSLPNAVDLCTQAVRESGELYDEAQWESCTRLGQLYAAAKKNLPIVLGTLGGFLGAVVLMILVCSYYRRKKMIANFVQLEETGDPDLHLSGAGSGGSPAAGSLSMGSPKTDASDADFGHLEEVELEDDGMVIPGDDMSVNVNF